MNIYRQVNSILLKVSLFARRTTSLLARKCHKRAVAFSTHWGGIKINNKTERFR
jgi:hypothetical protein